MCQKRIRKIKRGSHVTRLREARRIQRIQMLSAPAPVEVPVQTAAPTQPGAHAQPTVDKTAQNRVIIELALKTIALMYKNRLIQQKIVALQKETSDYVASIMSSPENQQRYLEHIRQNQPNLQNGQLITFIPLKLEPNE